MKTYNVQEVLVPLINCPIEEENSHLSNNPINFNMSVEIQRKQGNGLHASIIKFAVLIWLTFQNSIHTLLLRYSRVRDVPHMFYSSVAVFWMEIIKVVICLAIVIFDSNGITRGIQMIRKQVFSQMWDTLKVCIPAMLYTLQNNLFYIAASHLDAATFMIVSQLKIFSTALFSIILLKRALIAAQWVSLGILFIGVSLVQLQTNSNFSTKKIDINQNPVIGFLSACLGCTISGFAGVFFEKILKESEPKSLWIRNVQMSLFAIPCSFATSLLKDGYRISQNGFLYGFDLVVCITVIWYSIGGLSVAICLKYADNIAKNFATSVSIILATINSIYIFGFMPDLFFIFGAMLVILSISMYSSSSFFLQCFWPTLMLAFHFS